MANRLSRLLPTGLRAPRVRGLAFPAPLRAMGHGSVASLLKIALDVAYVLLALLTLVTLVGLVAFLFIPDDNLNLTVSNTDGGVQQALTRPLIVFGFGVFSAWFGGFLLILRQLRQIFRTLTQGDPFQPENVRRLRLIGVTLAAVTAGVWIAQGVVAARLAPGVLDRQGVGALLTPVFSVLVVFVLAEVFREGARLRRESDLTI